MLEALFTKDSKVEDLFWGASSGSNPSQFFSSYLSGMEFKPVWDEFPHNFSQMTDEADSESYKVVNTIKSNTWFFGIR